MTRPIFYAMSHSLYSAKPRAYLIKNHVDFQEVSAGHSDFNEKVVPAVGRWIIPVMEPKPGEYVQDGAAIIDYYEANSHPRMPAFPETPRHKIISQIFELFGGEGLLRPAMHYRWNFDDDNFEFLNDQFALFALPGLPKQQRMEIVKGAMDKMRMAAVGFGVVPETFEAVETAYEDFLQVFNAHFEAHPYLMGGVPTIGDYGLIAPMYAHLGRDPYPANMIKQKARAVMRWIERMNRADADITEFVDYPEARFANDEVPETLIDLMKCAANLYVPEVEAMVAATNEWLATNKVAEGDVIGGNPKMRRITDAKFEINGTEYTAWVLPYRIWVLQRIQDAYDGLKADEKPLVDEVLTETGMMPFVTARTTRRVERANNNEVWGA